MRLPNMKKILFLILISVLGLALEFVWFNYFSATGNSDRLEIFTVPQNQQNSDSVQFLKDQMFIRNTESFQLVLDYFATTHDIKPGGYRLSHNMNSWQIMKKVTGNPDLAWVTISFCPRKEQVGEKLAKALGWSTEQLNKWNTVYTNTSSDYFEGVYYPDTYLIPVDESGPQIANRLISHFNEKIAPLADEFATKNIKWTKGLKIASLIAREAGGPEDMKLISGIIWNRLNKNMALQIDATMQYTLGKSADGSWWGNINLDQKQSDSPYNSYLNKGLPPTPICSPNIDAIEAAVNPEETDCLFYLHDTNKQIHCAKTYAEHKANIDKYLRV
jgi:UPF0755 protein